MKHLFLAILLITLGATARATDIITSAAGSVEAALGSGAASVTSLAITGPVNAADLHFIASLPALTTLDLSKARIEEHRNSRLATNHSDYKADQLPPYILAGAGFSTIVLPAGLTEIADGALMSTSITTLSIPASVKRIGNGALADCRKLTQLTIPATVTETGTHLCDGATSLARVSIGTDAVAAYAFRGCTALTSVEGSPTTIGDYAFAGCTSLKSYPFGPSLTHLGTGAFYGSGLTAALGSCRNLKSIGDYAFAHCTALASVNLPEGVTDVGEGAFFDDNALTSLSIPSSVTTLGDFSLKGTSKLDSSEGLLSDGVTTVGRYAMAGMESLTNVRIPAGLTALDDYAMVGMTALESIDARRPREVPETGADVWRGIDQSKVTLYVDPSMENSFLAADQWSEFAIVTSGMAQDVIADGVDTPDVRLAIAGSTLEITSSVPVVSAAVYDTAGHLLVAASPQASACELSLPLDRIAPQVLLVNVSVAASSGASTITFKIAK